MKILLLGHKQIQYLTGGIEAIVTDLAEGMGEAGHDITVMNRWNVDQPKFRYQKMPNVRMIDIPTVSERHLNAVLYSFGASMQALFGHYDVINIHAEGQCMWLPLMKLCDKKTAVVIHGLDWQRSKWNGIGTKYIRLSEKIAAKYADTIIVLSEDTQAYFRDVYHRRTVLVTNGRHVYPTVKTDRIEPLGLEKGGYYLYLGRISAEKRLDLLIHAYSHMQTKRKLVIAGDVPDFFKETEAYREAEANPNIVLAGFSAGEFKAQLFSNAHAFVLPSDIEGASVALLEALSYGIRVLTSDIAENKRLGENYADYFRTGDEADLQAHLARIDALPFSRSKTQYDYYRRYSSDQSCQSYLHALEETVLNGKA